MLVVLSPFIVHIIKTEKKNKIRNCNFNPLTCDCPRFERIMGDARKSKPASGFRLNGPHERICFASRYFFLWFCAFLLFLDHSPLDELDGDLAGDY
jgi:hypothetical protein